MRNIAMLEAHKDGMLIAFPIWESKGTRHCVGAAIKRGHKVKVVEAGL